MKNGSHFAFFLVMLSFLIFMPQPASAIGIAPALVQIENGQGFEATYDYYVRAGSRAGDITITVNCRDARAQALEKYVTVEFDKLVFTPGEIKYFKVFVNVPSNFSIPGRHLCMINAEEVPTGQDTGMTAYSGIGSQIYIRIPYPDKYIEAGMDAPDVNKSMPVPFTISLISRGLKDVLVHAIINVKDSAEKTISTLYTESILIESLQSGELTAEWDSSGHPSGVYKAIAEIEYGIDEPIIIEKTFRLGEILVEITNITYPDIIEPDKIVKFDVSVQSFWNMKIENAYIEMAVSKDGAMITSSRSESFDISRWEEKSMRVYLDTNQFEEGYYDAKFTVYYSGRQSEKSLILKLERSHDMLIILLLVLVVAIIVTLLYFLRKRKKRKGEVEP